MQQSSEPVSFTVPTARAAADLDSPAAFAAGAVMLAGILLVAIGAYVLRGAAIAQVIPEGSRTYYLNIDVPGTAGVFGCVSGGIGAALVIAASVALYRIFRRPLPGPRGFPLNP